MRSMAAWRSGRRLHSEEEAGAERRLRFDRGDLRSAIGDSAEILACQLRMPKLPRFVSQSQSRLLRLGRTLRTLIYSPSLWTVEDPVLAHVSLLIQWTD